MEHGDRHQRKSLCVVLQNRPTLTETFIRSHLEGLPANVVAVHGWRPSIGDRPVLSLPDLAFHKMLRAVTRTGLESERTAAYLKVFRQYRVDAVLAEYGNTATNVVEACRQSGVPLIAHFHGYDASMHAVLAEHVASYPKMFAQACAIIAVSRAMQRQLIALGAPEHKVVFNAYGVDCTQFSGAAPKTAGPIFLAVGRLTEKKAPDLLLAAFAIAQRDVPTMKLRVVGDGPLMKMSQARVAELGLADSVTLLGAQGHSVVEAEMRAARCFVQHSIVAPSGDSEGTPVSIIEASATGLPVISTRHAGIPDVVVDGETGFLVEEKDVKGMAERMIRLATQPDLAAAMGAAAQCRVREHFSIERSLGELWRIIESCITKSTK
jgi:colanic acid/amylovoran biosynthesis glycosyltransferase